MANIPQGLIPQVLEQAHWNPRAERVDPEFYRPAEREGFVWIPARTDEVARLIRGFWIPTSERVAQAHLENKAWMMGQYSNEGDWIDGDWTSDRKTLPPDIFESKELKEIKKILAIVEENKETLIRIEDRLTSGVVSSL